MASSHNSEDVEEADDNIGTGQNGRAENLTKEPRPARLTFVLPQGKIGNRKRGFAIQLAVAAALACVVGVVVFKVVDGITEAVLTGASHATVPDSTQSMSTESDSTASSATAPTVVSSSVPSTVPSIYQGIWSTDCAAAADGTSQFGYEVYGPNLDVFSAPSLGASTSKVINVLQENGAFAVSEDGAYDPNNDQATPNIVIAVFQVLSNDEIELFSTFTESSGITPGAANVIRKCDSAPAFTDSVTQANSRIAPTSAEIAASHAAFLAMPRVMGVKWTP